MKMAAKCILFVVVCYLLCDFVPAIFFEGEHGHERPAILHRYTREFLFSFQRHTPCSDLKLNLCDIVEVIGNEKKSKKSGSRGGVRERLKKRGSRHPLPTITLSNVRALQNKMDELTALVRFDGDFRRSNLMCFTETWHTEDIGNILVPGFTTMRADRDSYKATSFCINCGDMLCSTCKKVHGNLSATRHHIVEDLSSLTPDKIAANRPATCAVHADETCKLFCPTHGVSICHVCAWSQHRSCPEVKDLEEKVEEARAVLAELAAMLSAGETELGTAISQLDQQLRETEKRTRAAIAEMEATCDRLESAIKACRRRLKELTETAVSDVKEAVLAGKTCLLQRRGKLTSHKRVVELVQETKSRDIVTEMTF